MIYVGGQLTDKQERLVEYVTKQRHREGYSEIEDEEQLILDMVKEYSTFQEAMIQSSIINSSNNVPVGEIVGSSQAVRSFTCTYIDAYQVLTGVTGALGAHILDLSRRSDQFTTICCLVGGTDTHLPRERGSKSLEGRGLPDLSPGHYFNQKVSVLRPQSGAPQSGLAKAMYEKLASEVTAIIHVA